MTTIVTTQEELDAAIERGAVGITIDSPPNVWLKAWGRVSVAARGYSRVEAWGSSSVVAWGSSSVKAWGSSHVEAHGSSFVKARESSTVEAWELSHVEAQGSSRVEAWGSSSVVARGSSSVVARGSSRVVARESSSVEAWESSRVEAWGYSHVKARGSSTVVARESSSVEAWESSSVEARELSHVEAAAHVAVHLHSAKATVSGGVVIDVSSLDLGEPRAWVGYRCHTEGGTAIVYKAVSQELVAGQGRILTDYPIGETVTATDWRPEPKCGHGLHFSPSPTQARDYYQGDGDIRYLACEVDIATLIPLGDKCKAPRCKVLHEVDQFGEPVAGATDDDEQENTL